MTGSKQSLPQQAPDWLERISNPDGFDPSWPPEQGVYFERSFTCTCGEEWIDVHDADCNDRCPACNREIEPHKSRVRDALTGQYVRFD